MESESTASTVTKVFNKLKFIQILATRKIGTHISKKVVKLPIFQEGEKKTP